MQFHCFKGRFTFFAEIAEIFFGDFICKNAKNKVLRNFRKKSSKLMMPLAEMNPAEFQYPFSNPEQSKMNKKTTLVQTRFVTKIIKPLALLKFKLVEQLAMDNEVNDLLKEAEDISISFNHFPEINKLDVLNLNKMKNESLAYQVMFDLGNGSKHGGSELRKIEEQNTLHIGSAFEINEKMQFGFLGNEIYIKHFKGRFDFLETAISAATYMGNLIGINTNLIYEPRIAKIFTEDVSLKVSTKYQFSFSSWSFHFYRRDSNGVLHPSDLNGKATIKLWTSFTSDSNGFRWE